MGDLIFGRGESAINFLNTFAPDPNSILGFVETEKSSDQFSGGGGQLSRFTGKPIFSVDEIFSLDFDRIFIANQHYQTLEQTLEVGIPEDRITIACYNIFYEYKRRNPTGSIRFALTSMMTPKIQARKIIGEQIVESNGNFFLTTEDYVRIGMLQMLAEEILNRKIDGEIAELGVHRGDFAQYMNQLFPNRTLNLFDTFDGLVYKRSDTDLQQGLISTQTARDLESVWKDASVDLAMSKMKYPARVQIHKGFFPETIPPESKTFALVSIDVGMHESTLEGLRYFYPRLSEGGFIMLRCYNDLSYGRSIHKAVEDFESEVGRIVKIPIVDEHGSLIISK